jgi:hypothetical protein
MADDVALVIKALLLPATAMGNVATDFRGAVSTGGFDGGGVVPPPPESFLHDDAAANKNTNAQNLFLHTSFMFINF